MLKNAPLFFAAPVRRLAVGVAFANLLVLVLVALSLESSYQLYRERAAASSRNTNLLVSRSIASEIDRIDLGLRAVVDEYARQRASGRIDPHLLAAFLSRQRERLPMLDSLRIADADGVVVYRSEGYSPIRISAADRDYFIALRANPRSELVISRPVLGRISGKWVMVFARRLNRPDGRFDGIVFASVAIGWFEQKFSQLEIGPKGAVVMRGDASRDFDLLARVPKAGFVGQTTVSDQFRRMIGANPQGGTYEAYAGADRIRRVFSYQKVADYPLITLVGLASEDIFAGWWREVLKQASLAAAFGLMTILGSRAVLRAWRARSEAYEQFRLLLTSSGAGIFGIDTNGICTFCNPAAISLLGYAGESDLLGRDMGKLVCRPPLDGISPSPETCRMLAAVRDGGRDIHVDGEEFRRADGTTFPVEYRSHPQRFRGMVVGAVVNFADITERKRAEEALKRLNENLEQRVTEEVAKNREKDHLLIQQSRLAAMGEMIHNIAHQWRQPLTSLTVMLSNIKDEFDAGELTTEILESDVRKASALLQGMSSTIDDFRDFFHPNQKKAPFSLMHALAGVTEILGASLANQHILLEQDVPGDITVIGYGNEFAQMLLNVVNNAGEAIQSRHVEGGRILVEIRAENAMAVVRVTDNGGGIPEDVLPKIFDPYFTTKAKGGGIGLYMAKAIVENNMGGKIEVCNTADGARFTISVPLSDAPG